MAAKFKFLRAVQGKSYVQQGEIYFTCRNYRQQPQQVRARIDDLCRKAAGEYWKALREYLTTDADWRYICDKHYISSATLDRIRIRFYELW